jgi:hypothetical protein
MSSFVAVSNGLVIRESSTNGELPALTVSEDPWINTSGLNPHPVVGDHYNGANFTLNHNNLSIAQAQKIAELRDACADRIKNFGYSTGMRMEEGQDPISFCFGSKPHDQSNLYAVFAAASASTEPTDVFGIVCGIGNFLMDAVDWQWRDFTVPQVKQIVRVLHGHITASREVLSDQTSQVLAATTVQEVNAIVWSPPSN